tara:strand:+ start:2049 stop:2228 length:180 start_codon:yes stop_codon:yes gene_type:complete
MTRRHFNKVAQIMATSQPMSENYVEGKQKRKYVEQLADFFQSENPRFDRERFINACYQK